MEGHFRKSEPILMDDEILEKAILEQVFDDQAKRLMKEEGIDFNEILTIRLEYRNIMMISHLWDFTSLAKLDLNNNLIEKIEGLDHLINLTYLNLSFNCIEKIQGLESLLKLETLNLSNNKISVLENMDTLENLNLFFIADNHVGQLDNVIYLRKFKNLCGISLRGNPVSKEDDYTYFILAYFPNLVYLDFNLLDQNMKNEASIKYQNVLDKMKLKELQIQQDDEAVQSQEAELKLHKDAFVEFLNSSHLFKSMLEEDPQQETLHCVPEVAHLLETFERGLEALCMKLFKIGLAEHKHRETEVNRFFSGLNKTVKDCQQQSSQILAHFEEQHRERKEELEQLSDPDLLKDKINHCNDEIDQLCNSLMELEFHLISQLSDIVEKLDACIADMVGSFNDKAQGIFGQCRALLNDHHEKVKAFAVATLAKMPEDMPEDLKDLFRHKAKVMDTLAGSQETHLIKLNDRETELVTRTNAWRVTLVKATKEKEMKHNRMRLSDIQRYADYLRKQLEKWQ